MNWTPGPARCRSPEYEAEIAFTDMGGAFPIGGRIRRKGVSYWYSERWAADGSLFEGLENVLDLMPPTITREALADECLKVWNNARGEKWGMGTVVAHVIDAVKAGRVE